MSDRGLVAFAPSHSRSTYSHAVDRYLIRLIHHRSRRPFPGSRFWTTPQLGQESIVNFLRARNRDGYDVSTLRLSLPCRLYSGGSGPSRAGRARDDVRPWSSALRGAGNQSRSSPGWGAREHTIAAARSGQRHRPRVGALVSRPPRQHRLAAGWAGWQDAAIKNHAGVCPADWLPG